MTALHYAAYFDVAPVLDLLLRDPKGNFFPFLFCCLFTLFIYLYTLFIYLYTYLFLIEANISVWILMKSKIIKENVFYRRGKSSFSKDSETLMYFLNVSPSPSV